MKFLTKNRIRYLKIGYISILFAFIFTFSLYSQTTFSGERLRQACIDYIVDLVGGESEIIINKKIDDITFDETAVSARCVGQVESFRGNCYINIEFHQNSKLLRRLQIPVRVRLYQEIPVLANSLLKGSMISKSDFYFEKREVTNLNESDIIAPEKIVGKKAKHNLSKGTTLTRAAIEEDKLIHRGDRVLIIVESGTVRITASGEALQEGLPGEIISVRREGEKNKLQGVITEDGAVLISLNSN